MRTQSWPWLRILLVLVILLGALGTFLVSKAFALRNRAWPALQQVATRLATDEEARSLYRANPYLARRYESEEDFLQALAAWRKTFGALPDREPANDGKQYRCRTNPGGISIRVQGTGGAWMALSLNEPPFFIKASSLGEGITNLAFADSPGGLMRETMRQHTRNLERRLRRLHEVAEGLKTEEGVEALLKAHPGLAGGDPSAFKARVRSWRADLAQIPSSPEEFTRSGLRIRVSQSPFEERLEQSVQLKDAKTLRIVWQGKRLAEVHLQE